MKMKGRIMRKIVGYGVVVTGAFLFVRATNSTASSGLELAGLLLLIAPPFVLLGALIDRGVVWPGGPRRRT